MNTPNINIDLSGLKNIGAKISRFVRTPKGKRTAIGAGVLLALIVLFITTIITAYKVNTYTVAKRLRGNAISSIQANIEEYLLNFYPDEIESGRMTAADVATISGMTAAYVDEYLPQGLSAADEVSYTKLFALIDSCLEDTIPEVPEPTREDMGIEIKQMVSRDIAVAYTNMAENIETSALGGIFGKDADKYRLAGNRAANEFDAADYEYQDGRATGSLTDKGVNVMSGAGSGSTMINGKYVSTGAGTGSSATGLAAIGMSGKFRPSDGTPDPYRPGTGKSKPGTGASNSGTGASNGSTGATSHTHQYKNDWVVDKNATCTEPGEQHRDCSICGAGREKKEIPALGHTWGSWETTKEATCSEQGISERVCQICKAKETKAIKTVAHKPGQKEVQKEATCEETGLEITKCTVCGQVTTKTTTPKKGHKWGQWVTIKEATCDAKGTRKHKCETCGKTETEKVGKTQNHDWELIGVVASSCTEKGVNSYKCRICGKEKTETADLAEHTPEERWTIDVEPTCTHAGQRSHHCAVCGAIITTTVESVPKTDHEVDETKWEDTGTGYLKNTCLKCGEEAKKEITYDIAFDAGMGFGTMNGVMGVKYNDVVELPECTYQATNADLHFIGWALSPDDTAPLYNDKAKVSKLTTANNGTVKLYALWSENVYSISFNANGGKGTIGTMGPFRASSEVGLPAGGFAKTGYTLIGWSTDKSAETAEYALGGTIKDPDVKNLQTIILYAVWKGNTYTITFDSNSSTGTRAGGAMSQMHLKYGERAELNANGYTRDGFSFYGWTTTPGGNIVYRDKENVLDLQSINSKGLDTEALTAQRAANKALDTEMSAPAYGGYEVVLYAKWGEKRYKATLDPMGGELSFVGADTTWTADGKLYTTDFTATTGEIKLPSITANATNKGGTIIKKGYAFKGWVCTQTGKKMESIPSGTSQDLSFYAEWDTISYTIVRHGNGGYTPSGLDIMTDEHIAYDTTVVLTNPFSRQGYIFYAWTRDQGGDGSLYIQDQKVSKLTNESGSVIDFYAQWRECYYRVVYSSNEGETSEYEMSEDVKYSENLQLAGSNFYAREGYKLVEWNTSEDGTGISYAPGATVSKLTDKLNYSIILYAIWKPVEYTIHFEGNGAAAGSMLDMHMTYGETKNLPRNQYTRDDQTFYGWATDNSYIAGKEENGKTTLKTSGNGKNGYADCDPVINLTSEDGKVITFYAIWGDFSYDIRFNKNKGSGSTTVITTGAEDEVADNMPNQRLGTSQQEELSPNRYERRGYTFDGWNTREDGSGTYYEDRQMVQGLAVGAKEPPVVDLYAMWKPIRSLVEFNPCMDDVAVSPAVKEVDFDAPYGELPEPETTGYVFMGWYTDKEGTGERYYPTTKVTITSNITLYAYWEPKKYILYLNENGGNEGTKEMVVEYGKKIGSMWQPTYTGYTLVGWSLSKTHEDYVNESTIYRWEENKIVYGIWVENTYKVMFVGDGATGKEPPDQYLKYRETLYFPEPGDPSDPFVKEGYHFTGWAIKQREQDASKIYQPGDRNEIWDIIASASSSSLTIRFYAQWELTNYTITYRYNGGTLPGGMTNKTTYTIVDPDYTLNNPTRTGYDFDGWIEIGETTTPNKKMTIKKGSTGNKTFEAKWTPHVYNVTITF